MKRYARLPGSRWVSTRIFQPSASLTEKAEYEERKAPERGSSRWTFKRRRSEAYELIAKSLDIEEPLPGFSEHSADEPLEGDQVPPPGVLYGEITLRQVLQHVGALYYAALAHLFPRTHYFLSIDRSGEDAARSFALDDALSESFFISNLDFYVFWANSRQAFTRNHDVLKALHGVGTDQLVALLDDVHQYGPIFHGVAREHYQALEAGFNRTRPRLRESFYEQSQAIGALADLYEQQWLPWLRADYKSAPHVGSRVPRIIGKCREIINILTGYAKWAEEDLAYYRSEAHLAVRDLYRVARVWRPDQDYEAHLREFVDMFFDADGAEGLVKLP